MNRRRMLSSVHRRIAQHEVAAPLGLDHTSVSKMSIADLDRLGPRLVSSRDDVEPPVCPYCSQLLADSDHTICHINAQGDR